MSSCPAIITFERCFQFSLVWPFPLAPLDTVVIHLSLTHWPSSGPLCTILWAGSIGSLLACPPGREEVVQNNIFHIPPPVKFHPCNSVSRTFPSNWYSGRLKAMSCAVRRLVPSVSLLGASEPLQPRKQRLLVWTLFTDLHSPQFCKSFVAFQYTSCV